MSKSTGQRIRGGGKTGIPELKDIAKEVGCTRRVLNNYKRAGVDVRSVEAVKAHRATLKTGDEIRTPRSPDLQTAKLRLTNAQAGKAELEEARLRGELVSVATVREDLLRIGGALKARLLRLESDLPPLLHGLEPGDMELRIRETIDSILEQFADSSSTLYRNQIQ